MIACLRKNLLHIYRFLLLFSVYNCFYCFQSLINIYNILHQYTRGVSWSSLSTGSVDSFTKHTWITLRIYSEVTFYHIPHSSWHILSFSYSIPPSFTRSNTSPDLWSTAWKRLLPSPHLSPAPFPWVVFSWDSSFILSKPFVADWKLADAGAIKPKLFVHYEHPSLSPRSFRASQWTVH